MIAGKTNKLIYCNSELWVSRFLSFTIAWWSWKRQTQSCNNLVYWFFLQLIIDIALLFYIEHYINEICYLRKLYIYIYICIYIFKGTKQTTSISWTWIKWNLKQWKYIWYLYSIFLFFWDHDLDPATSPDFYRYESIWVLVAIYTYSPRHYLMSHIRDNLTVSIGSIDYSQSVLTIHF